MTTIRDVAKQSGYSATTVSIVLNNAPLTKYVSAETKNTIKKAAEQLHYHPNAYARCLRGTRTHSLGIMVFDLKDPYCTQILSGIERSLHGAGYVPILTDIPNNRIIFQRSVERLMERQIEGLVTLANSLYLETELLTVFEQPQTPVVIIGRNLKMDSFSPIEIDNKAGTREALRHLFTLGHRRIAFIKGPGNGH